MIHVYPLNDLREHDLETTCWCCPRVDWEAAEAVAVHNAADHREVIEQAEDARMEVVE